MLYREVLNLIEQFMIGSGFREYCRTVCKGKCCGNCSTRGGENFPTKCQNVGCASAICIEGVGREKLHLSPHNDELYRVAMKHLKDVLISNNNSWWHTEKTHIDKSLEFDESKLLFFKSHMTFNQQYNMRRKHEEEIEY